MPFTPNPDGMTWTATDPSGRVIDDRLPASLVPLASMGSPLMSAAPVPPAGPDLRLAANEPSAIPEGATVFALPPQKRAFETEKIGLPVNRVQGDKAAIQSALGLGAPTTASITPQPTPPATAPAPSAPTETPFALPKLAPSRTVKTPERMVPLGGMLTQEKQMPVADDVKLRTAMAEQNLQDTIGSAAQTESDRLQTQAEELETRRKAAADEAERVKREAAQHKQDVDTKMAAIQQQSDDLASMKVDPDAYSTKRGTFATIMAKIGIALGAGAATAMHTRNFAQEIEDAAVSREIDAQKANNENKQNQLTGKMNLLAQMRATFLSPEAAEASARALMLDAAAAETARQAAERGSDEALATADTIIAQLREASAAKKQQAAELEAGTLKTATKLVPAGTATVGGGFVGQHELEKYNKFLDKIGIPKEQRAAVMTSLAQKYNLIPSTGATKEDLEKRKLEAETKKLEGETSGLSAEIAPGVRARGGNVEAKEVRTKLGDLDATDKMLADLQASVKAHPVAARVGGARVPFTSSAISPEGASIESRKGVAVGGLGQLSGSGVVNPGEYPRLVKSLDTPDGIQGVRDVLAAKRKALIEAHGDQPLAPPAPSTTDKAKALGGKKL